MKIEISSGGHAEKRMFERGITRSDIDWIIHNPTASWDDSKNGSRVIVGTTADGKVLRVVVLDPPLSDGTVIVKTAYHPDPEDKL